MSQKIKDVEKINVKKLDVKKRDMKLMGAGIFAAVGASLCCITPVLAVLAGISGAASAFSWLDPFRPYLIAMTVLVLGFAWYQKLKPRTKEEIDCACETDERPSFWQSKKFLGIVTIFALVLLAFPFYSGIFFPEKNEKAIIINESNLKYGRLHIEGMTCTGCEHSVNYAVKEKEGIIKVESDYKTGIAIVKFDNGKISLDKIAETIEKNVGYKVIKKELSEKNTFGEKNGSNREK